jgi:hypothetical protein
MELININKKTKLFIIITAIVLVISNGLLLFIEAKADMFKGLAFSDYQWLNRDMYAFDNNEDFLASLPDISDEELQKKVAELSTNNNWKEVVSKKADEITDKEYLALSVAYINLDYSDIEKLLSFCVKKEKTKGDTVYYRLDNEKLNKLITNLHNYYCSYILSKDLWDYDSNEKWSLMEENSKILNRIAILYGVINIKGDIINKSSDDKPLFNVYEKNYNLNIDYNLSSSSIIISDRLWTYSSKGIMEATKEIDWPTSIILKNQLKVKDETINMLALNIFKLSNVSVVYSDSPNDFYTIVYPSFKTLKAIDLYNQGIGERYGEIDICDVFANYDKIDTLLNELSDGKCDDYPSVDPKKQKELFEQLNDVLDLI